MHINVLFIQPTPDVDSSDFVKSITRKLKNNTTFTIFHSTKVFFKIIISYRSALVGIVPETQEKQLPHVPTQCFNLIKKFFLRDLITGYKINKTMQGIKHYTLSWLCVNYFKHYRLHYITIYYINDIYLCLSNNEGDYYKTIGLPFMSTGELLCFNQLFFSLFFDSNVHIRL